MNDIQRTVDELRFILQREVIEETDELKGLVEAYSQFCHDVNVRLRRCNECVKQGLRSEAVHLAEAKPNLLDAIAILDFPERHELIDVISMYFMTPPEPLLTEVGAALNEAYAEHAPLERLLDKHRLLALGRAPLVHRLSVLRSLADLDATTPHWDQDVREMEKARFRELEEESIAATKSGNSAELNTLVVEIQNPQWREAIPTSLSRSLKSRTSQTVRGNARQRLMELNEQLHAAFSGLDATKARTLRQEWKQQRQLGQIDDGDPLSDQVEPIFNWLDEEDRKVEETLAFNKCVGEIERAIESEDVTAEDLKRLKLAADRYERRLPKMVEARYQSRLDGLELHDIRKMRLIVGATIGVVAIIVGIFGLAAYASMEGSKTRRLVAAASEFIDEGKITEAQKLIDQFGAQSTSEAWLCVKKKLSDAQQAEQERAASWITQIATIRESNDTILVEAALKKARDLARTAEEKLELGSLQASWQKRANEVMAEREQEVREAVRAATTALTKLDTALSSDTFDPISVRPAVDAVANELAALIPVRNKVSRELNSQVTLLESRLNAFKQTVADQAKRIELVDRLSDAVLMLPENPRVATQPDLYRAIVAEFAASLPQDPRVATLNAAAELAPYPATQAFQKLLKRWGHLKPADKVDVETRLKEIRSLYTEHPQTPDRDTLTQYESWLTSILRRFEVKGNPDEGIQRRFITLLSHKTIKEAQVIQDTDGYTYYLHATPTFSPLTKIIYQTGFNGETDRTDLKLDKIITAKPTAPPQQEIAAKARTMIRDAAIDRWRDMFQEVAETLRQADKIDSFLQYLLIYKAIESAGRGDSFLEKEVAPLLKTLNDEEIDRTVAWMDPKSKAAGKARSRAKEVLSKVTSESIAPLFAAANERQKQLEQSLFAVRFSVGWLEKAARGGWTCHTKWSPQGEYSLHAASRPDATGMRQWTQVGFARHGSFEIDAAAAQAVGEANVIFASLLPTDSKTAFKQQQ